jgi:sirohydrochlorin ferrochelatase
MASAATQAHVQPAAFILTTDLEPYHPAWRLAEGQAHEIALACAPILGFEPVVRVATNDSLADAIDASETFVLPVALDFNLFQRDAMGRVLAEARRHRPDIVVHHDDVDPGHSLVVDCLANQVATALGDTPPQRAGLILAPSGQGDAVSRAHSYRLMRLIWERLGLATAEIGFIRHSQPFLQSTLDKCARHPLQWILLPQSQWITEHVEFAETILENFQRSHPETSDWRMAEPPGHHPALTAWLVQRIARLWNEKRAREAGRVASPKHAAALKPRSWTLGQGTIASIPDKRSMAALLERVLPVQKPDRVLVKVTWHGYATGTYTDPAALDLLLGALPSPAIILEGHTSSRTLEDAKFDWETEAKENRAWIRQQEAEYLRRTGLADVLARHRAAYVNVTEAFWDGACTSATAFAIPEVLLQYRGCPMISFAKFKGPTRLGISNLFGLLPEPLRAAWHGPNITYFARVCCDLARAYGALFPLCGANEALFTAVRWNRQGLYRSRWGNYDLISNAGHVAAAPNLVTADILASRIQGQDVHRSAFFDVVRAELGWDEAAATDPLPLILT